MTVALNVDATICGFIEGISLIEGSLPPGNLVCIVDWSRNDLEAPAVFGSLEKSNLSYQSPFNPICSRNIY